MIGIPSVAGLSNLTTTLQGSALALAVNAIFGKQWGLYNEYGVPLLLSNHVVGIQYNNGSSLADAPLEKGSFASYNKVANPYTAVVQLVKGDGSVAERNLWLAQIEAYARTTIKFYIVSPEFVYINACIESISYSRSAQEGQQLIRVNIALREVREVKVDYASEEVAKADDAKTVDSGNVQPKTENTSLLKSGLNWIRGS